MRVWVLRGYMLFLILVWELGPMDPSYCSEMNECRIRLVVVILSRYLMHIVNFKFMDIIQMTSGKSQGKVGL